MLPSTMLLSSVTPPKNKQLNVIKIKSPKSDIKVHSLNFNVSENKTELASKGHNSNSHNDDVEKITQCWDNLKVSVLSKAIAIAPDVGCCTIGPKSEEFDFDKPDLSEAVTSTPVKQHPFARIDRSSCSFSQIKKSHCSNNASDEKSSILEALRIMCLNKYDTYINNHVQKERERILKSWEENDEKVKEMGQKLKAELENERILRMQENNKVVQQMLMEIEANARVKVQQQQQQVKVDHEKRIAETEEKLRQIEQKRKEVEENKRKHEELKKCIDRIYQMHVAYNRKYCQINEINKKCVDMRLLSGKVSNEVEKLKSMNNIMMQLVEKSKEGVVSLQDLETAEALVKQITVVSEVFKQRVDEINNSVEKANKEKKIEEIEKDLNITQEEAIKEQDVNDTQEIGKEKTIKAHSAGNISAGGIDDCISKECLKWYIELRQFLEEYEQKLEPLVKNDSFKKFRFDCQKVVNLPVNAISPLDDLHLQDKLYKLGRLLQGKATPLGSSMFLATGHPLGISFCTNLLAKKFVKQGELTVSSKPEAAFAIAAVIVGLWVEYPEFGKLLLAHFHRECPYLIPAFLPQVEGQSNEDYYRMLGYEYSEDGKVEPQDKFLRRMSGVMRLYAAILVTPLKRSHMAAGKKHPLNMKEAWRWLTESLNLSPRPDISPTLLFDFLDVTGEMMLKTYRNQFTKILQFLCTDYFPMIKKVTPDGCSGPVTRLECFLQRILKEGKMLPPHGLLPVDFW